MVWLDFIVCKEQLRYSVFLGKKKTTTTKNYNRGASEIVFGYIYSRFHAESKPYTSSTSMCKVHICMSGGWKLKVPLVCRESCVVVRLYQTLSSMHRVSAQGVVSQLCLQQRMGQQSRWMRICLQNSQNNVTETCWQKAEMSEPVGRESYFCCTSVAR